MMANIKKDVECDPYYNVALGNMDEIVSLYYNFGSIIAKKAISNLKQNALLLAKEMYSTTDSNSSKNPENPSKNPENPSPILVDNKSKGIISEETKYDLSNTKSADEEKDTSEKKVEITTPSCSGNEAYNTQSNNTYRIPNEPIFNKEYEPIFNKENRITTPDCSCEEEEDDKFEDI